MERAPNKLLREGVLKAHVRDDGVMMMVHTSVGGKEVGTVRAAVIEGGAQVLSSD